MKTLIESKIRAGNVVLRSAMAIVITMLGIQAQAQISGPRWRGGGGWGPGGEYARLYNTNTVETFTGEVARVRFEKPMKGMGPGIHLDLRTDKEPSLEVHLGRAWFIANQDAKIATGDEIEIKGSRITFNGKPAVIAAEVRKGDEVLTLRDKDGRPVWAGWRRSYDR